MSENRYSGERPTTAAERKTRSTSEAGRAATATGASLAPAVGLSARMREYRETVLNAASAARSYLDETTGTLSDVTEEAKNYTRLNPGAALVLSAAAGLILALLLPRRLYSRGESAIVIEDDLAIGAYPAYAPARVTPQTELMAAREYIVSQPPGLSGFGRLHEQLKSLNTIPGLQVLDEGDEDDNKVVLLSDAELADLKARVPGLVIEPNIFFKFGTHMLLQEFNTLSSPPKNKTVKVRVVDSVNKKTISGVPVYLVTGLAQNGYGGYKGITGKDGICRIAVARSRSVFEMLIVDPEAGYWTRRIPRVPVDDEVTIELTPLPCNNSALYDWGHTFAGMHDDLPYKGDGITIGIIDSGVSVDHPGLHVADGRNCVRRENSKLWYEDASGHGTHCAGVVAATLARGRGVKGYVPQAKILAYKTVPKNAPGPILDAVLRAIKWAVKDGCDIISMSFGTSRPDVLSVLSKDLTKAYEKGIFCVAAAGNDSRDLHYPAAFPFVMGVGAFGHLNAYPSDSLHAEFESDLRSRDGNYYVAKFSNRGRNIDFCAPGVAVLSTVPGGGYTATDGTSIACPQVAGIAGLALAAHPEIRDAEPNAARVDDLVRILKSHSEPLGFGPRYEGAGGLRISSLIGA